MRGRLRAAVLLGLFLPAGLAAQRPSVSPVLPRVWDRDTTLTVWLFVRPAAGLEQAAQRVAAAGARVRVRSRWLHAISADAPTPALHVLARDAAFQRLQPLGRFRAPRVPADASLLGALADTCPAGGDPVYGPSEMPYRQLNIRALSDRGVDGAGVRVALLDTGFDTANPAFAGVTITAQRDFVFGDSVVRDEANDQAGAQLHGTATWSLFAADVPERLRGIARGATFLLAKTEDVRREVRVEEDQYVAALEWADSIGVDLVSSSLGYLQFDNGFRYTPSELNGDVAVTTVAADLAAQRGILVLTAAGNSGPGFRTLGTPADADSGLAIGAEDSLGNVAGFSSRGPTADGRLKPDFTAPGADVCAVTGNNTVRRLNGTSFSTPITAAAATLVKQLQPTLGPIALRDALRRHAVNRARPDSTRGWGRPDAVLSAVFPLGIVPVAPESGTLATVTPTFTWSAGDLPSFARPVSYRLRVARDTAFGAPLVDTIITTDVTYDLPRALKPGLLFWQVDGTAASGQSATSAVVGPVTVPEWATLTSLSVPGGTTIGDSQPTFTWTSPAVAAPPGPFTYDLFVRRVSAVVPDIAVGGLTGTRYTLTQPLERNVTYTWALVVHAGADTSEVRSVGTFLVLDPSLPAATLLYQNFPNPFPSAGQDSTCLWFDIAVTGLVKLDILDLRGNPVRRFIPGPQFPAILSAGRYGRGGTGGPTCDPRLTWDGRADDGRQVPPGVYLTRLQAGGAVVFKRIVFQGRN